MKLLVLSDIYPSKDDPASAPFISEQVKHLRKYHAVMVMVIGRKFIRPGFRFIITKLMDVMKRRLSGSASGVTRSLEELDVLRVEYPVLIVAKKPLHLFNGLSIRWTAIRALKKSGYHPDLIYAHKSFPAGYAGWKIKKRYNTPVITIEFQGPFTSYFEEPYRGKMVIKTIRHVDRTIYTKFQLKEIQAYGIAKEKLGIGYYGVDTERFLFDRSVHEQLRIDLKNGLIKLLTIGRIEEAKGISYLVEAVGRIRDRFPSIRLSLVGPLGSGGQQLLDSIKEKGLEGNIRYMGSCLNDDLPDIINGHHILVSASLIETYGVTIIEAMACGKPVVATRCGGPEDTVNGQTGVLVGKGSASALAEGIRYVIDHYDDYRPDEVREYVVSHFSQDVVIRRLNDLIEEVTGVG